MSRESQPLTETAEAAVRSTPAPGSTPGTAPGSTPSSAPTSSTANGGLALSPSGGGEAHAADEPLQLVTFEVGSEEFAIDILTVQEIIRMMQITRVPQSPPSVEGVINLRGQITPVVDLRQRFGLSRQDRDHDARIVVVEVSGRVLGFIVDRVNEVLRVSRRIVDPAPALATGVDSAYVRGVGKLDDRLLILLDLERLFGDSDLSAAA